MLQIKLDDKPNLQKALAERPDIAKQVIKTFIDLIEESFDDSKGINWADTPGELSPGLSFADLIKGILRGSLDVQRINPDTFDVLKIEVHPLSMLAPRKNYIDGSIKYYHWRDHFRLPENSAINADTIAAIFQKMLRYAKYIDMATLSQYLQGNQIATYRGLGLPAVEKLPFQPALILQGQRFGDLQVGKFFDDIGFFDCGENSENYCLACKRYDLQRIEPYKVCLSCNAGYIDTKGGESNVTSSTPTAQNGN